MNMDEKLDPRATMIKALKDLRAAVEEEEKKFASLDNIDEMRNHIAKMKKMSSEIRKIRHLVDGMESRWLTIDQAEAYKNLPHAQILKLIQSKKIKAIKRGKRWYIDRENLDQYLYNDKKKRAETGILRLVKNEEP